MRVVVTGAAGFLGWHTRVRLKALTDHIVVPVDRLGWSGLLEHAAGADAVIHVAGVNRGESESVESENIRLAEELAAVIRATPTIKRIVYANSIQAEVDNPYGRGKARAAQILAKSAQTIAAEFADIRLPNLFGEGGRPNYNSFVATFVQHVIDGTVPDIADRSIRLLHVQDAAAALIDALEDSPGQLDGIETTVQAVYDTLRSMLELYGVGDIPPLLTALDLQLFNTLRFALFPDRYPILLPTHADHRGALIEAVKSHGGQGQTFASTTVPGVTRGEHFHLRKVERFVVISGAARISLRKVLTDEVVSFDVNGENPVIIDMPTMWAHNITNTSASNVVTLFWTNEIFDPQDPDTHRESVGEPSGEVVVR